MIGCVEALAVGPRDDSTSASIIGGRGVDGVLPVVASVVIGEDAFPVLEDAVVLAVRLGPAIVDQFESVFGFQWQVAEKDGR